MKKILIFHANAGAGHRKAAEAAARAFLDVQPHDTTVLCRDALDFIPPRLARSYTAGYLWLIAHAPLLWGIGYYLTDIRLLQPLVRICRRIWNHYTGRRLAAEIAALSPDAVLCFHFFSAEVIAGLRRSGTYQGLALVGVTDFGVHRFWVHPGIDHYFVASQATKDALCAQGVPPERISITGIPIEGKFASPASAPMLRDEFGLAPDVFTILVTSGGFGVGPIAEVVRALDAVDIPLQLLVVCGNNVPLRSRLQSSHRKKRIVVLGYVDNMHECMGAADLIFSKSGGLTVSESLAKGLPMIIMQPIPGQESINARVLERAGAGIYLRRPAEIPALMGRLSANNYAEVVMMRERARALAHPHAARSIAQWVHQAISPRN